GAVHQKEGWPFPRGESRGLHGGLRGRRHGPGILRGSGRQHEGNDRWLGSLRRRAASGKALDADLNRSLADHALHLFIADEVLVAVLDLAPVNPLLVEPGPVRGAEVLDEMVGALAQNRGVLPRDLSGVDDQVAVLAAADDEAVLGDLVEGAVLTH